jgi:hypothetical protein
MAGGSAQSERPFAVREIARGDQVLVASCLDPACGAQAIIGEASAPVLRNASIDRLEEALRCVCGARRGRLTARPFWGPRPAMTGGIYLFVI